LPRAHRFGQTHTVTVGGWNGKTAVRRILRKLGGAPVPVMGEPARRQDNAPQGANGDLGAIDQKYRPGDPLALLHQPDGGVAGPERNPLINGRPDQTRDQRIAVAQLHCPTVPN
jgi:hypothetical protein